MEALIGIVSARPFAPNRKNTGREITDILFRDKHKLSSRLTNKQITELRKPSPGQQRVPIRQLRASNSAEKALRKKTREET